jgi:Flp pilus assembly protein TadB
MTPERLNDTIESTVAERPLLQHLLDFRIVGRALAIAVVVALIVWLIVGPALAAIVLLLVYFGGWYALAQRSHDQRRPSRPADEDADTDTDAAEAD